MHLAHADLAHKSLSETSFSRLQGTTHQPALMCRARQLLQLVDEFRAQTATAGLQKSVAAMEDGAGTAGNFMRYARHTRLTSEEATVPARTVPLQRRVTEETRLASEESGSI